MSVWRIKSVTSTARERAQAAAEKSGIPLSAWLEQAIMRRVGADKPDAQSQTVTTAPSPTPTPTQETTTEGHSDAAQKADTAGTAIAQMQPPLKAKQAKRKRTPRSTKSAKSAAPSAAGGARKKPSAMVAEIAQDDRPATSLAISAPAVSAPTISTLASEEASAAAPIEPPMPVVEDSSSFAATTATDAAPPSTAEQIDAPAEILPSPQDLPPDDLPPPDDAAQSSAATISAEPPDQAPIVPSARERLARGLAPSTARRSERRLPLVVVGAALCVIAVLAVGGYFLLDQDEADQSTAQNPPPASATNQDTAKVTPPVAAPPPATPAPATPAPAATATTPATPPSTASATPVPPAATAPTPSSAPPSAPPSAQQIDIPRPIPGVQPSLLVPVPGNDSPTGVDLATRPPPVVISSESLASVTARAEAGDSEAQIELGKRYMQGAGVDKSPAEALRWLEKAAASGNGQAQFNVGVMYEGGIGTPVDLAKAIAWYRKAAAQPIPVPSAMHNLALIYAAGSEALPADPVQARALMIRAAELGLPRSQYSLALMYHQGLGGAVDNVMALSWLALAARSNDPQFVHDAQQLLTIMTDDEKAKAQQIANQHVAKINENIARLRALAAAHAPDAASPSPAGQPLDRAAIVEMQKLLASLKLYAGAADGANGPKTEQAIRDYQAMAALPVDGKATPELLTSLREVAGAVGAR